MYLVRESLNAKVYHLFDGEDTACKLWTTSHMKKDRYKMRQNVDDLCLCTMCFNNAKKDSYKWHIQTDAKNAAV